MLKLIIGNRAYSSWSMRGWLAVKQSGEEFEELVPKVTAIITRGGGYGIHVVTTVSRNNEVRSTHQSFFTHRLELRLTDAGESTIDRKLADNVNPEAPGRALTPAGLQAIVAREPANAEAIEGLALAGRDLRPALEDMELALTALNREDQALTRVLDVMGPAVRYVANATGKGPKPLVQARDLFAHRLAFINEKAPPARWTGPLRATRRLVDLDALLGVTGKLNNAALDSGFCLRCLLGLHFGDDALERAFLNAQRGA